jgi:hypothetical protein
MVMKEAVYKKINELGISEDKKETNEWTRTQPFEDKKKSYICSPMKKHFLSWRI